MGADSSICDESRVRFVTPGALTLAMTLVSAVALAAQTSAPPTRDSAVAGHDVSMHEASRLALGPMSGTARLPASTPMRGRMLTRGGWTLMGHASVVAIGRAETGFRGSDAVFHTGMAMGHARRRLGAGWFGLEVMLSTEPLTGPRGYPLLLQTGETADGERPLVDRQHPHDMLMAVAASYRWEVEPGAWAFLYAAPVGSPALGPTAFMHRESGEANPVAPISHHFLDATHISHGVMTAGLATDLLQFEVSWFNGREPDQRRWRPDAVRLNSFAGRLTVAPGSAWAIQGSFGDLKEPEQLHPAVDVYRATVSVAHRAEVGGGAVATTLAWGRNTRQETTMSLGEARRRLPGPLFDHYVDPASLPPGATDDLLFLFERRVQSAVFLETSYHRGPLALFGRFERARKDELFPPIDQRHSTFFDVGAATLGTLVRVARPGFTVWSLGVSGSVHFLPDTLHPAYGERPLAGMVFVRLDL